MIQKIILVSFVLLQSSCWVYNSISENKYMHSDLKIEITNCIDSTKTNKFNQLLKVNGYYESVFMDSIIYNENYVTRFKWDTVRVYMILYSNGLVSPDAWPYDHKGKSLSKNQINIETYLKDLKIEGKHTKSFYDNMWGISRIAGDTLIVQQMHKALSQSQWNAAEIYYKILDKNAIQFIGSRWLGLRKKVKWVKGRRKHIYNFVTFNDVPTSDKSWICKQKWAWCQ